MASVWCAEDRVLGRQVAIKVLSDRYAQDAQAVRRFKREARAVARVSAHPNVVTIFDVGDLEADEHGDELARRRLHRHGAPGRRHRRRRAALPTPSPARRRAGGWREAAEALDHAHARGIVHRDIKPANFLLDRDRGLHVADFGIARLQSEETITSAGELFGTAAYLAPEQALGKDATSASDRYALAVAAFELLTGGRPYTAQHFAAQARQHIEEEPPRASERDPSLPPAVDDVLARGMAKEPEARYPTALAFVQALDAALDGEPTASTRVARPGRRPIGSRAARSAASGAAAAVTAGPRRRAARAPRPPAAVSRAPAAARARRAGAALAPAPEPRAAADRAGPGRPRRGPGPDPAGLRGYAPSGPPSSTTPRGRSTRHRPAAAAPKTTPLGLQQHAATSTAAASSTTPAELEPAGGTPTSASALQLQGHQELVNGNYTAAIPTLEQRDPRRLPEQPPYAYALYDLGDALLRSGNAKAAIPVLQQRLQIPNQTATVQALLNQALQAAGQAPPPARRQHGRGERAARAQPGTTTGTARARASRATAATEARGPAAALEPRAGSVSGEAGRSAGAAS